MEIQELERYTCRPGDVILVHVSGQIPRSQEDEMVRALASTFPHNKVLLLDHGTRVRVLNPTEAAALEA